MRKTLVAQMAGVQPVQVQPCSWMEVTRSGRDEKFIKALDKHIYGRHGDTVVFWSVGQEVWMDDEQWGDPVQLNYLGSLNGTIYDRKAQK